MRPQVDHFYVHIPFCSGKCAYCALYSVARQDARHEPLVQALIAELDLRLAQFAIEAPHTIFFGGGTPTYIAAPLLDRLTRAVTSRMDIARCQEWTVEGSPETIDSEKCGILRNAGVNRLSMGVQSFRDETLAFAGRRHTVADVYRALEVIRDAGFTNHGIDMIAGLSGNDPDGWHREMSEAVSLGLPHLSVYGLTLEDKTRLERWVRNGRWAMPDDDAMIGLLGIAEELVTAAGYQRYEISNYARPGRECAHNLSYWSGKDYLGIGPGASSRVGLRRWTNETSIDAYIRALAAGSLPPCESDELSVTDDLAERAMFGIRTNRGIELTAGSLPAGTAAAELIDRWRRELEHLRTHGVVEEKGGRWILTPRGRLLADTVASVFVG